MVRTASSPITTSATGAMPASNWGWDYLERNGDEVTLREMVVGPPGHGLGGLVSEKADKAVGNVANNGPHLIGW